MNLELLDRAAAKTTCNILELGGGALVQAGAIGIATGGVGFVPMAAGAAMLLAANYGCGDMPLDDAEDSLTTGCIQVATRGAIQVDWVDGTTFDAFPPGNMNYSEGQNAQKIKSVRIQEVAQSQSPWWVFVEWEGPDGQQYSDNQYTFRTREDARSVKWSIRPFNGDCTGTSPETKPLPPEMFEPQPYTDVVTNCNFNITFQGMAEPVPGGPVKPVYLLQQAADSRADGGVMGGCNWPDTIFMPGDDGGDDGGGEPPVYIPVPDDGPPPDGPDGVPWWAAPLLAGSTSAALQLIGQGIDNLTAPKLPPGEFTLQAPCDVDEDGNPLTQSWTYPEQNFESRSIAHQITMLEALQTHLNWKTPTCSSNERPAKRGQWVSTRWISDEKMDHSNHRLRKLFRYRTESTRDLGQLSTYWRDFVWQAGDVCVVHQGAWWGNPQVWASTEAEGQRVIRHAAAEAGLDPDQDGEWAFSSSNSPRYGMSGTMKIQMHEGFPWVAKREGASYPNTLALAHDP